MRIQTIGLDLFMENWVSQQLNWLEDELKELCVNIGREKGIEGEKTTIQFGTAQYIINMWVENICPPKWFDGFYLHSFKSNDWLTSTRSSHISRLVFYKNVFLFRVFLFMHSICVFVQQCCWLFFMRCVCNIRSKECDKKRHHHIFIRLPLSVDTKSHITRRCDTRGEMFINTIAVFVTIFVDAVVVVVDDVRHFCCCALVRIVGNPSVAITVQTSSPKCKRMCDSQAVNQPASSFWRFDSLLSIQIARFHPSTYNKMRIWFYVCLDISLRGVCVCMWVWKRSTALYSFFFTTKDDFDIITVCSVAIM